MSSNVSINGSYSVEGVYPGWGTFSIFMFLSLTFLLLTVGLQLYDLYLKEKKRRSLMDYVLLFSCFCFLGLNISTVGWGFTGDFDRKDAVQGLSLSSPPSAMCVVQGGALTFFGLASYHLPILIFLNL